MGWQYPPHLFPLVIAAVTSASLALLSWRRRAVPGAWAFLGLMGAVAGWSLGYALELASADEAAKLFWAKAQYLGIVLVPAAWLVFALQYTGRGRGVTRRFLALLSIEPLITLALVWTNEGHRLIWRELRLITWGNFSLLESVHGAAFWIHTAYSYLLLLLGTILLFRTFVCSPTLYRRQAGAILVGMLVPWAQNALYLSGLNPFPYLDLTPFAFTVTGLAVAWALFRFRLFDIVPVAREAVIESMEEGLIVLDRQNRIVDINPAAARVIGCTISEAIGRPANQVLVKVRDLVQRYWDVMEAHTEITMEWEGRSCYYDLRISPLRDERGRITGRVVLLRNITKRKRAEEALRAREQFLALLNEITRAALEMPDLPTMTQVLADRLGELFHADGCYITLWDEEREVPIPAAAYGEWRERYRSVTVMPDETTVTGSVLAAGRPLVIEDVFDSPYLSRRIAETFPDRSLLALPLIARERKLGAALIAFNEIHHFTPEEIGRGEQVAQQIALALDKALLLEEVQAQWREAETLRQAAAAITETLSLDERLERILVQLERVVPYDSASVQLLREGFLEIVGGRGFPDPEAVIGLKFPIPGDNPNTIVVLERRPVILRDARSAHLPFRRPPHDHIRSWLGVPLIVHDQVIGILAVDGVEPNRFDDRDIRLVIPFANQVAVAIENARLFEETRRLKVFNENIVQSVAEAILIEDARGVLTFANPAAEEMLGYTREELIGLHWTALTSEEEREKVRRERARHALGATGRYETVLVSKEGRRIPVIVSARPFFEEGRFVGVLSALTDITERKQAEIEREKLIEDLDAFAHTVAHDLKAPLSLIVGFAEVLLEDYTAMPAEEREEFLRTIVQVGRKMSNIVDELLLLASVRSAEVEMEPLDMAAIVAEAQQRLTYLIAERQAQIILPEHWPVALGYGPWVEEVWVNYLSNAIKYGGQPPRIELGATVQPDGMVRFWVRDNGPGLTPEEQARLFTPFTRLDQLRVTGHGLGLSIVRRIVEKLGGEVGVTSEVGQGSTFSFTLVGVQDCPVSIVPVDRQRAW